jgi:hypothetical protein
MSRRSQLGLIIAACFFTATVIIAYLVSHQSEHLGNITNEIVLLMFFAVPFILIAAAIAFIIQGFRVHWGWGLANIFLFPLAGIALFIRHRQEAKIPMMIWTFGMAMLVVLLVCVSLGI